PQAHRHSCGWPSTTRPLQCTDLKRAYDAVAVGPQPPDRYNPADNADNLSPVAVGPQPPDRYNYPEANARGMKLRLALNHQTATISRVRRSAHGCCGWPSTTRPLQCAEASAAAHPVAVGPQPPDRYNQPCRLLRSRAVAVGP